MRKYPHINVLLIFCLIAISMFIYLSIKYTYNLPMWDDYDQTLSFMNKYVQAGSMHDKILLLLSQHNEHRILTVRLSDVIYYDIFGKIDFRCLIYISQILLLLIIFVLYFALNQINSNNRVINLTLSIILVLCTSAAGSLTWLGSAMQQNSQMLFSLLAIFMITRYEKSGSKFDISFYCLLFVINGFTGGGWIILTVSMLLYLAYSKRMKLCILTVLMAMLIGVIYFKVLPYNSLPHEFHSIFKLLLFIVGFTGSTFFCNKLAFLPGVLIVFYTLFNLRQMIKNKILLCWLLFFFTNALVIGVSRQWTGSYGYDDRYTIYSLVNLAFVISFLFNTKYANDEKKKLIIMGIILFFSICSFLKVIRPKSWVNLRSVLVLNSINYPNVSYGIAVYEESKKLGIYDSEIIDEIINDKRRVVESN